MFSEIGYIESLKPEKGFQLHRITATTYSLEPHFVYLLTALFEYEDDEFVFSDLALNKSLASFSYNLAAKKLIAEKRLNIFYQKDKFQYAVPSNNDIFAALIRECCHGVAKEKYAFHPKMILAEYINNQGEVTHRLLVSSRNLTMSDYLETQICLQRKAEKTLYVYNNLHLLIDYVSNVADWKICNFRQDSFLEKHEKNISKIKLIFQCPNKGENLWDVMKLGDTAKEKIILSPFYSDLEHIENASFYFSSEKLHSKMYLLKDKAESTLWIGSANCTRNGLRNNYECMVGISFREDISGDYVDWLREKEIQKYSKKSLIDIINQKSDTESTNLAELLIQQCNITCTCELVGEKYKLTFYFNHSQNFEFTNIRVSLLSRNSFKRVEDNKVEFCVTLEQISNGIKIRYEDGQRYLVRVCFAQMEKEGMKKILEENTEQLAKKKLDMLIPNLNFSVTDNDYDEENDEDSLNNIHGETAAFSASDEEYEKLVKLFAFEKVDALKKIQRKICENMDYFEERKSVQILTWIEGLLKE